MEVDLLRPGTVPISPDTFLGFEFLLDKDLLIRHLQKANADPSPTDLITKFYDAIVMTLKNKAEPENIETAEGNNEVTVKHPIKNIAMKILSLKIAAFLNWNLAQIRSLPFKTQISLLQDLMYFTSEEKTIMEIPNIEQADTKTASPQFLFALLLFHRWLLNTSMHRVTSSWQQRYGMTEMSPADENIICCPDNIKKTVTFLTDALQWEEIPLMLTYDCFNMPTETNEALQFEWTKGKKVSRDEFCAQICFDLATFFFYREEYDFAKQQFAQCLNFFNSIIGQNGFATIDTDLLNMYMRACDSTADLQNKSLTEQLNNSIVNQFVGLTAILQKDNVKKEISLVHRLNLELDVQGALSSGVFTVARDLLYKVKALNHIRCVLEKKLLNEFALSHSRNIDNLIFGLHWNWNIWKEEDKKLLKNYLFQLIIKEEVPNLYNRINYHGTLTNMFSKAEIMYIKKEGNVNISESLLKTETSFTDSTKKKKPQMEMRQLERQLIITYDWKEIKDLITKIAMMNFNTPIWEVNPQWKLPIPLESVIKGLPRGFLQDYSYVLLAKSKEQFLNKNWNMALELLIVLDKELQAASSNISKLYKMVNWEVLVIQITQLIEDWPNSIADRHALGNACEVCFQTNDTVLPRTEVIETCAICLLNLRRWEFLLGQEKKWAMFEITSAIALACHEIVQNKGTKKFSKNLWDLVLPIFSPNSSQSKRGNSNYNDNNSMKNNLMSIFLRLKDTWCLTVVISLLTKLYNIFKDETNLELQVEYMNLWPNTVSNASSYNINATSEILSEILTHALKEYPSNISWLRLMGDVNFANGNYKISMSFYLKSLIICNDYFNLPIRYDDHVTRRMIKCCQALGCYTQAAVLCQFLEDPDYALAFRILGDQKLCNDAVDAYYHCFWDINILEFLIHIHNRRGEFQRRKCATQVMGMLELNSNNNEEIQREASNLRKSVFLRALCKQYVF
ncbi:integrator complex subunit 8 [Sitophilus oryzae]|uniref:Integrator complex subunit 8 n=1 Tax=Sitophilus oryzae TaxID=7048 RepID=A0A6J2XNW7_SITOR|nr:integrator complex subunit 8 [Sitophilus oryzae]